jgi:hypothetical protein
MRHTLKMLWSLLPLAWAACEVEDRNGIRDWVTVDGQGTSSSSAASSRACADAGCGPADGGGSSSGASHAPSG